MAKIKLGKRSLKSILLTILSTMLCVGLIFGVGAAVIQSEEQTQKTISSYTFGTGGLNSSGIYVQSENQIYTKEAFSCKGLTIEIDFENSISYQVYFYDEKGSYVSQTAQYRTSHDFADEVLANSEIRKCRVVITPKDDESTAFYEVQKYAKQLTIKVDKIQSFEVEEEVINGEATN